MWAGVKTGSFFTPPSAREQSNERAGCWGTTGNQLGGGGGGVQLDTTGSQLGVQLDLSWGGYNWISAGEGTTGSQLGGYNWISAGGTTGSQLGVQLDLS